MLYRSQLRRYAVEALLAANTIAGANVFAPRDWPTNGSIYPAILVQTYRERKESRAKGSQLPQFIATAVLAIEARLQVSGDDRAAAETEDLLETFNWQIEQAILTAQPLLQNINRFVWVDTDSNVTGQGRMHIGELKINFGLEFPVDIDPFTQAPCSLPPIAVPLTEVQLTYEMPAGTTEPALDITLPQ